MYSNNILNFQESTTSLKACTKKSGNLLNAPRISNILIDWPIGLVGRVFANDSGDQGSIPGHVVPKTQKNGTDASLLNTQHYKVQIKGKGVVVIVNGVFRLHLTMVANFTYIIY